MDQKIEIKLKLLDNSVHKIQANLTDTIRYLKEQIENVLNIPLDKQRLIFSGRQLKDEQSIVENQIENGHVIHLVARPNNPNQEEENQQQLANNNQQNDGDEVSVLSDLEVLQDIFRTLSIINQLFLHQKLNKDQIQIAQHNQRKKFLQQRTKGYTNIQKDKFCESIQQNQDTVDILIQGMNTNFDQIKKSQYVESFDFMKTKYKVGQWVDVRDTVNQWLEAQIIKINEQEQKLFIHYNGWATRWDEWIDAKSDRIALFRTHTVQSQASLTMSPYPTNEIDGDRSELPERRKMDDILFQTCGLLNSVNSKLIQLSKISNKIKFSHEKQEVEEQQKYKQALCTQLAPIFDRTGRMMMDLGMLLGEIGSESQRIDNDEDEEEKSQISDQNEQQQVNNMDIQSVRSNSSLGRYSIQQNDGNQIYEGSQSSHNNRNRQRHNYRFQVPVMLNPGELHKINSFNAERFQISRIVQIPQNNNLQ